MQNAIVYSKLGQKQDIKTLYKLLWWDYQIFLKVGTLIEYILCHYYSQVLVL